MVGQVLADDPPAGDEAERRLAFMRERMWEYEIREAGNAGATCDLNETPLLRWNNPVSGTVDGAVFVWMRGGRPAVLAKVFINEPKAAWGDARQSLSTEPLVLTSGGVELWTPPGGGLEFTAADGAAPPAATGRGRLRQMRSMARRARAEGHWGEEDPAAWELRLMAEPLVRYADAEAGILDGAIFGFSQGTNPEAILILEAVDTDGATAWRAAASRLTKYGVRVDLDDRRLADLPRQDDFVPAKPFHHSWHKFGQYPFKPATPPAVAVP